MLTLQGVAVAPGVAIGRAVVLDAAALDVRHYRIDEAELDAECERLRAALDETRREFAELADDLPGYAPPELRAFLHVHDLILQDPLLVDGALTLICEQRFNAGWALATQGNVLAAQFAQMEDPYLRERGQDVQQVVERVLQALAGTDPNRLRAFERVRALPRAEAEEIIAIAHDLSPADMLRFRNTGFAGFATDLGAITSHTAIVARSLGVPAVVAMNQVRALLRDGDTVVIDGAAGMVHVNPSTLVLAHYRARLSEQTRDRRELQRFRDLALQTTDGTPILLYANIDVPEEAELAHQVNADGIGLFRSEFLFMNRSEPPDEEEQYQAYARVVSIMAPRPVTIRTIDVGADKMIDIAERPSGLVCNPALGLRAVRYSLAHSEIFGVQLRAILRAAQLGPVRILIPMVTHPREMMACRQAIDQAATQLRARSAWSPAMPVAIGAMVEVPAAAIAIDRFLDHLDFVSIGTNDLIQYTLAIDRSDPAVAHLYDPTHPAVLWLLNATIAAVRRAGKPVAVCGEMAGDPAMARILLNLGLAEFSLHPARLLPLKREIMHVLGQRRRATPSV